MSELAHIIKDVVAPSQHAIVKPKQENTTGNENMM